jgi:hypothetical protein
MDDQTAPEQAAGRRPADDPAPHRALPEGRALRSVRRQLRLTRLGLWAERITRAFWPAWSLLVLGLAAWSSGLVPPLWEPSLIGATALLTLVALVLGWRQFDAPTRADAADRLDASLPGRPLSAVTDMPAPTGDDPGTRAVWEAHVARMARRLRDARAVPPDLRVSSRDPYALRYMALLLLGIALLFGTLWRAPSLPLGEADGPAIAAGPTWEGWLEPPRHTELPTLYLADLPPGEVTVPEGTRVILRLYGEVGRLSVTETVSGRTETDPTAPIQEFTVTRSGTVAIDTEGEDPLWSLIATPDEAPAIAPEGELSAAPEGTSIPWRGTDDHGILAARLTIVPDLEADRRHGLAAEPDPREPLVIELPLPISGDRREVFETTLADIAKHPFAGLPVVATFEAVDALEQTGASELREILPGRPFYDPMAAALVEQRRDLLWARGNGTRVAQVLRALTWEAEPEFDGTPQAYVMTRMALRRLEAGEVDAEVQEGVA